MQKLLYNLLFIVSLFFMLKDSGSVIVGFFKDNFNNSYLCFSYVRFVLCKRGRKIMMFGCKYSPL